MSEKNIIRTNKRDSDKPFVMIERSIFENTGLSWRAKGLLGYLLSRPDDWSVCVADLVNRSTDGRDACYAAIKELGDAGYIIKSARPKQAGRFGGFEYVVFEKPVNVPQDVSPVGKTVYGKTVSGKSDTTYNESTNNESTNNKNTNTAAPIVADTTKKPKFDEDQFEFFWSVWPKRVGKEAAKKAWAKIKMTDDLLITIIKAVNTQKATWIDLQFVKHPATWLNGKCWEDEILPASQNQPHSHQPALQNAGYVPPPPVAPVPLTQGGRGQAADFLSQLKGIEK